MKKILISTLALLTLFSNIYACETCEKCLANLNHLINTLPSIEKEIEKDPENENFTVGMHQGIKTGLQIAIRLIKEYNPNLCLKGDEMDLDLGN